MTRSLIDTAELAPTRIAAQLPGLIGVVSELVSRSNELCGSMDTFEAGGITNAVTSAGADPTGVNSSTSAIQSVINSVAAGGGGEVYIPYGTYRLTQASTNAWCLTIPANVKLRCAPGTVLKKDTTLAATSGKSVSCIIIQGDNVSLQDVTIDGSKAGNGWDANFEHQTGIFSNGSNVNLTRVRVYNCGGDGLQLAQGSVSCSQVYCHDNNRHGFCFTSTDASTPVVNVRLTNCRSYNNGLSALDSEPSGTGYSQSVVLAGCDFDIGTLGAGRAIIGFGARDWAISGSRFRGCLQFSSATDISISGCTVNDAVDGGGAIFLNSTNSRISVSGCTLRATHSVANVGVVRIIGTTVAGVKSDNVTFTGCVIDASGAHASCSGVIAQTFYSVSVKDCTLIGPGVANSASDGFHIRATDTVEPCRFLHLEGNTIRNFGAHALAIGGLSTAKLNYLHFANNVMDDTTGTMTVGADLDNDGLGALQSFSVLNCRGLGGVATLLSHTLAGSTTLVAGTTGNTGWVSK